MKKSIVIVLFAISMALVFHACNNSTPKSQAIESKPDEKAVYTCTMHPEIQSDKPADCPKCGMELVKLESEGTEKMKDQSDTLHSFR